jgi:hypothetical protein
VGEALNISKRLVALAVGATVLAGLLAGPASAHPRTITSVSSAVDEEGVIYVHAFLNPDEHPGTMRITLKKKNAAGDWVAVKTKKAPYGGLGWGYFTTFNDVAGNKRCKGNAKFTSRNHPTLRKASPAFDC